MPKGYWIANVDVHDAEVYDKYRAANAKPTITTDTATRVAVGSADPALGHGLV